MVKPTPAANFVLYPDVPRARFTFLRIDLPELKNPRVNCSSFTQDGFLFVAFGQRLEQDEEDTENLPIEFVRIADMRAGTAKF